VTKVTTIDFHVTCECNQECPYCWGPQGFEEPVDTATAEAIIGKISSTGAQRIVFTGGDPLLRSDIGVLVETARSVGLEVALSTTGDELTRDFLVEHGASLDLISLPLDGASESVSSRTKKEGHFAAVIHALETLGGFPTIDVKVATPVTRLNMDDVPGIVRLLEKYASRMGNRFFYNVFQAFPRAMSDVEWGDLVITNQEFQEIRSEVEASPPPFRINWLGHDTLDRLYVMIFPDGSLTVPSGGDYLGYGPFLDVKDLKALLSQTDFDAPKHELHSKGWSKTGE
jgi:MoaA/NifB/PqqE/SkfB family radical SAM enzyme